MCEPDSQALKFTGQYTGEGAWTDITGESKRYRVRQTIAAEGNRLIVSYTHSFFEEGTSSGGELHFDFVAGSIFTTTMNGTVVGHGYLFDDYLHFNIRIAETFVETSYQLSGPTIFVRGSSAANAQGRFIAWTEKLTVTP